MWDVSFVQEGAVSCPVSLESKWCDLYAGLERREEKKVKKYGTRLSVTMFSIHSFLWCCRTPVRWGLVRW